MDLRIYDRYYQFIGVVDVFTSLRWTRKHYTAGEFELKVTATENNINLLKKDNMIYKSHTEAAIIETVELAKEGTKEEITVKGYMITGVLKIRCIDGTKNYLGTTWTAEKIMFDLVNSECINPVKPQRVITNLELGVLNNYTGNVNMQVSYDNLLDTIESIGTANQIGFRIQWTTVSNVMIFNCYKGTNRTINQKILPPVIFDIDYDNVISQDYYDSDSNLKNCAIVAGEGEGAVRAKVYVNDYLDGRNRVELFCDAKDLQRTNNNVTMTDVQYQTILTSRGNEKLGECQVIQTFEGQINTNAGLEYRVDYDLGDWVTRQDKKWGITLDTQITEITEVYQNNSMVLDITFGNNIPTEIQKIKREIRRN
ncbi:siphovirus ReqiPepy6 Gp37-like family protein [Clostridium cellulovorans]|uniref:Gp28/Gp37-like domain-containing protein n=1 Tax=Clostridium cellulovorans (strain ATCC 35296 / DSM 3052 / OCM 3 / 743B) TaxID=573061 RepID=D9SQ04_CLOC7|nr:siphovirus ReqiPepy6 Gp37-like family protein [Clostridium cellulovorans]ADL52140.1 hypothetical protein Clocel_2427 [Clostridium cellulovorans 743B]